MKPLPYLLLALFLSAFLAACDSNEPEDDPLPTPQPRTVEEADYVTTESGLKYFDFNVGDGPSPVAGQRVFAHYTGWLTDGTMFDTSRDRGPIVFTLGTANIIPGWNEGLLSMQVGGDRQLVIPPDLAYGASGQGSIPPNATLIFEIELLDIQ